VPLARPAASIIRDGAWVALAAAILLLPALLWGRPFVFGDSAYYWGWGGDILDALQRPWPGPGQPWVGGRTLHGWGFATHDATAADLRFNLTWLTARSAFYAIPFRLLMNAGGLWLVAAVQALVTAWTLKVAVRAVAPTTPGLVYVAGVAGLAAVSSIGFEVGYAMPDLFGGLAVLAAMLLTTLPDRISRSERAGLMGLIVYAVLGHSENSLNMAAAVVLGALWYGRAGWRGALDRVAPTVVALVIGLAVAGAGGVVLGKAFGHPAHMPPFPAGRMLADGAAQSYLRQTCPKAPLAACDLAGKPPVDIEYYLWVYPLEGPPSAEQINDNRYALTQFDRLSARHVTDAEADQRERFVREQGALVLGGLKVNGVGEARAALPSGVLAVINFGVGHDFDTLVLMAPTGQSGLRDRLDALTPGGVECVSRSASCGRFDLSAVTPVQYAGVLIAIVSLVACGFIRAVAPTGELPNFLTLSLGLVLANALICGVLSGPYARYQVRVEWVIPLGALLLIAQWLERSKVSPAPDR
jgi:hypothetical protein